MRSKSNTEREDKGLERKLDKRREVIKQVTNNSLSRVIRLVKKFPSLMEPEFLTMLRTACNRSQSDISPHYLPKTHSNIILPSTPGSTEWPLHVVRPKLCMHLTSRMRAIHHRSQL